MERVGSMYQLETKTMLIEEIKLFVTKKGFVNSILDFTIRLRKIKRNEGNYIY